jgi:CHASE1-domain containing sensor protein
LTGVVATWIAFNAVNEWERQRVLQEFQDAASDRVLMIQRELDLTLGLVQDIGSFFEASQWVGRREFRKYVGPALKRHDSIIALEWIPRVTDAGRSAFVADARRSFPRFRITESNPEGDLVDAGHREVYYPVLFVQPYQHHRETLGLDLASDPAILDALRHTRDAGQMLVSSRTRIEQDGIEEYGFVARLPVYKQGKERSRRMRMRPRRPWSSDVSCCAALHQALSALVRSLKGVLKISDRLASTSSCMRYPARAKGPISTAMNHDAEARMMPAAR